MKHLDLRNVVFGGLIGAVIVLAIGATNGPRVKWEYKIKTEHEYKVLEQKLNDEAKDGWEAAGFSVDERAGLACALLKRPVQ